MTFKELVKLFEDELGVVRLADVARELDVTPQVVSNWKARNQVPYKYVKNVRKKIDEINNKKEPSTIPIMPLVDGSYFSPDSKNEDLDLIELVFGLFKRAYSRKKILLGFVIMYLVLAYSHISFFQPAIYKSTVKILPRAGGNSGQKINSLASRFGVDIGANSGPEGFESSELIPDLIKSRKLAKKILFKRFDTHKFGKQKRLIDIYQQNFDEKRNISSQIVDKVANRVSSSINIQRIRTSPLLLITVSSFEATLSAEINKTVIDELSNIILDFKLRRLKDKIKFIDERMSEVNLELINAEDDLKTFRERNRNIRSSPALLLEQDRLLREVQIQTQVYISLKNQAELTQIETVGEDKIIEILDPPIPPFGRSNMSTRIQLLIALILSIASFFFYEYVFVDMSIKNRFKKIV